jgi:hypothetical protein
LLSINFSEKLSCPIKAFIWLTERL